MASIGPVLLSALTATELPLANGHLSYSLLQTLLLGILTQVVYVVEVRAPRLRCNTEMAEGSSGLSTELHHLYKV